MSKTRQQSQIDYHAINEELISKICKQQADVIGRQIDEKLDKIERSVASIVNEVQSNSEHVKKLEKRMDMLEQYGKRNNLIIYGVQENGNETSEDTEDKILTLFKNKLNIGLVTSDIEKCYRIGRTHTDKGRPILVGFLSQKVKTNVYKNKRMLKKTGFSMKEDLTKSNVELMKKAASKYGLSNVWSQNGKIYALQNDNKIWVANETFVLNE
ncbi:hypothetical protein NQ315_011655 [Exocentrus adspersus]|uniref:Uncharacterized protein n=1 Tax=Exocentrus adspersus TaxID=1586481 RepID=A0AAV8VBJ6_9CUCU|nr:hypothetical protein NQ315_011655 [Exocentrus adspersus]